MKSIDFLFEIDRSSDTQISTQIYEKIKENILSGIYNSTDRIPSIRKASESLKVSNSSIISAYFQLQTEGFIKNEPYKGYFVCNITPNIASTDHLDLDYKEDNIIYINDSIDKNSFQADIWRKNYNKILSDPNVDLTVLGDEQGEYELRFAIANFVRTHRGCNAKPEQIVIASGIQTLISILIRTLKPNYSTAFLEYPGYKKVEYIFDDFNYKIKKVPVLDDGIDISALKDKKNALIYVSPSYQYPLGKIMTIDKRLELIDYANRHNSFIIEDDYASIIRYDSKPISSLQGLDLYDNTIFLGSFSKTFLPSLRISFMILPKKLLKNYFNIKSKYTHTSSKLEQLALAKTISSGYMEKHLKRINSVYRAKNQSITKYINQKYKNRLKVSNNQSGFHIILSCKTKRSIDFLKNFKDEFLLIDIIEFENENLTFLFSFSGLDMEEIPRIIDKIVEILEI